MAWDKPPMPSLFAALVAGRKERDEDTTESHTKPPSPLGEGVTEQGAPILLRVYPIVELALASARASAIRTATFPLETVRRSTPSTAATPRGFSISVPRIMLAAGRLVACGLSLDVGPDLHSASTLPL